MNNLIKSKSLFIWMALVAVCLSCNDDFLEKKPLEDITPDKFFGTARDLQIYVNNFYDELPYHGSGYNVGTFDDDDNSDNVLHGEYTSSSYNRRLNGETTVPSSGGGYNWGDVRDANYFFDKLSSEMSSSDDVDVKQYIGEAYFFRAFFYFRLLKRFGDLPWIDKILEPTPEATALARISRKTIVENMVKDLDKAADMMKDGNAGESDRVNKHVALAFKARVCLYEGTWEKHHAAKNTPFKVTGSDGTSFLELARDAAKKVIDSGIYDLYKGPAGQEYISLFNKVDYSSNKEVLLWAKKDADLGLTTNINRYLPRGWGPQFTKQFVDDCLMKNGKAIGDAGSGYAGETGSYDVDRADGSVKIRYNNNIKDRDPRLVQMVHAIGKNEQTVRPNSDPNLVLQSLRLTQSHKTGYPSYKGANTEYSQVYDGDVGTTGSIIFRYAEVLLIYAEAQAELGDNAEATKMVDLLRDRVGMTKLSAQMPAGSTVLKEVRRERRVELVCEGHRQNDIFRWAAADDYIKNKKFKGVKYTGNAWLEERYTGTYKPIVDVTGRLNENPISSGTIRVDASGFFVAA